MIVMKFGGTSVGGAERIANVANIVKSRIERKPVVVVSAVTKITDALIRLGKESAEGKGQETLQHIKKVHNDILEQLDIDKSLLDENMKELENLAMKTRKEKVIDKKLFDYFQSFGERMSSKIVAQQLNNIGVKAQAFDAWELGFLTNGEFGDAEPLHASYPSLSKNIRGLDAVLVITGFIGKDEGGNITTLGRGGSDYSAAIIGAAIGADEIQIWTDVNGIMSTDPKIVSDARTIERLSFGEASELAYFGAKVLHPKTILPAMGENIPVKVLNSFDPENRGTTILSHVGNGRRAVTGIAYKKNITLIHVESTMMIDASGFMAKFFHIFDKYGKSVDIISTSIVSVSLTVDNEDDMGSIIQDLKGIANVDIVRNKAIICVVGDGMRNTPGIAGRTFTALGKNNINIEMISQGSSEINITFIVDGKDTENAVRILHKEYFG